MPIQVWACYNKNQNQREQSSSGGIYGLLAERILGIGGVVFAVCWDENFETIHRKIERIEDLPLTFGSKYVPSKLGETFCLVKDSLQIGKIVLFVGTPCQTCGLLSFLGKSYDNLYLVDFVCHGVPSKVAWRKFLKDHHLREKLSSLNMRDKSSGWSQYQYSWNITTIDGKQLCIPQSQVSFMKGFTRDLYLRPSCYECSFKGLERKSDITLGDFWGVWSEYPEFDDNKGISIVFIHSEKGKKLFESVKNEMGYMEVSADIVVKHNPSIICSTKLTNGRTKFFQRVNTQEDFDNLVESICAETFIDKIKRRAKYTIKKIITKVTQR